eukprot:6951413-Prymnesium_polylepis.1
MSSVVPNRNCLRARSRESLALVMVAAITAKIPSPTDADRQPAYRTKSPCRLKMSSSKPMSALMAKAGIKAKRTARFKRLSLIVSTNCSLMCKPMRAFCSSSSATGVGRQRPCAWTCGMDQVELCVRARWLVEALSQPGNICLGGE